MARRKMRTSRRKTTRRSYKKSSVPRALRNNHTMITRVAQLSDFVIPSNYSWAYQTYRFALSDVPSYTEFTNLFDSYKISAVKVTFFPQWSNNDMQNNGGIGTGVGTMANPIIFTTTADDDTALLSSQASSLQVSKARMVKNVLKPFSIYVRPKFQTEVATTLAFSSGVPKTGWCDTDNYGVTHYGAQIGGRTFYTNSVSTPNVTYQVFAKFYLQFKGAR